MRFIPLLAALVFAVLGACSSTPTLPPPPAPPPDERPDDFVLSATVFVPKDMEMKDVPRSLRPARFIVEPDGVLRASVGQGATLKTYPPQTRQLTPKQMDGIWREVRATNLLAPGNPAEINDPEAIEISATRPTALIYVGYENHRVTLRLLLDRSNPDAVAAERLVDDLAGLAWIRD